jgi:hypothetical protein
MLLPDRDIDTEWEVGRGDHAGAPARPRGRMTTRITVSVLTRRTDRVASRLTYPAGTSAADAGARGRNVRLIWADREYTAPYVGDRTDGYAVMCLNQVTVPGSGSAPDPSNHANQALSGRPPVRCRDRVALEMARAVLRLSDRDGRATALVAERIIALCKSRGT